MAKLNIFTVTSINGDDHWSGDMLFNRDRIKSIKSHEDGVYINYYGKILTKEILYNKVLVSNSLNAVLGIFSSTGVVYASVDEYEDVNDNSSNTNNRKILLDNIVFGVSYGNSDSLLYVRRGAKIEKVLANNTLLEIAPVDPYNFSDWYLPSKDDAASMMTNLYDCGVGGFSDNTAYWTSTESTAENAYVHRTSGPAGSIALVKTQLARVRACRTFEAAVGYYSLRDEGPGGGLIYYIDGTTYYETYNADVDNDCMWSNVIDVEIGLTAQGEAIGTGADNCLAIEAQMNHIFSAASVARLLNDGEMTSWFLPNRAILGHMDTNLHQNAKGDFTATKYWSSEDFGIDVLRGYYYDFSDSSNGSSLKTASYRVRACRKINNISGDYAVGDDGPGGGLICYCTGNYAYEAYASDQSSGYIYSNIDDDSSGGGVSEDDDGLASTAGLIAEDGHLYSAAYLCAFLNEGMMSTWFLPSLGETDVIYSVLHAESIGGFEGTGMYWTSNNGVSSAMSDAIAVSFSSGADSEQVKTSTLYVRACRKFTDATGTYEVGDETSDGGWVFYVDDILYYEASPEDVSIARAWWDGDSVAVATGAGETGFGFGFDNTYTIVETSGHTGSAAQDCLDYTV